jgi:hypothetical protein
MAQAVWLLQDFLVLLQVNLGQKLAQSEVFFGFLGIFPNLNRL